MKCCLILDLANGKKELGLVSRRRSLEYQAQDLLSFLTNDFLARGQDESLSSRPKRNLF
jgi:hypothetical protein